MNRQKRQLKCVQIISVLVLITTRFCLLIKIMFLSCFSYQNVCIFDIDLDLIPLALNSWPVKKILNMLIAFHNVILGSRYTRYIRFGALWALSGITKTRIGRRAINNIYSFIYIWRSYEKRSRQHWFIGIIGKRKRGRQIVLSDRIKTDELLTASSHIAHDERELNQRKLGITAHMNNLQMMNEHSMKLYNRQFYLKNLIKQRVSTWKWRKIETGCRTRLVWFHIRFNVRNECVWILLINA